jgi:hypothetical protein
LWEREERRERQVPFEKTHLHKSKQISNSLSMREWKWVKLELCGFVDKRVRELIDEKFVKSWLLSFNSFKTLHSLSWWWKMKLSQLWTRNSLILSFWMNEKI